MATKIEPNTLGDGIKWEAGGDYSRADAVIASGNKVVVLEVLGMITASEKYVPLDPSASDGSQVAAGIAVVAVDATDGDMPGAIINDQALVAMDNLVWPDGITAGQKTTAIEQLGAIGIKPVTLA